MATERNERTYRLEPLDTSGVFLGLGLMQCALLGSAISTGVLLLTAGAPVLVAAIPVVAGVAAAFARVHAQPLWAWLPLLVGWVWTLLGGRRRWTAPLPLWPKPDRAGMPPCLAGLDIVAVDTGSAVALGAVRDRYAHTLTAIVPVVGPQFVVEPRAEQERLLAGWGDVIGQFAVERGVVTHLSWSDVARPSGLGDHLAWVDAAGRDHDLDVAVDSYRELVDVGTATAISHDVVVSLTVSRERLGRSRAGTAASADHLERALVGAVDALVRGLRSAGLTASDPLDAPGIQRLLRTRIDPSPSRPRIPRGRLADRLSLVDAHSAGPLAVEAHWDHLRVDGGFHRTWWISAWPRLAVPPAWLEGFLAASGITRTMTVVLVPVPTHQSRRRIERDLVKLDSDATTKEDQGRRIDARHRRATQALLEREEELVSGFPEVAYAGLVTVSAPDLDTLDEHGAIAEQLAREHGMDLRVLDARQDVAWAAALPLGLAPKTLVGT